MKSESFYKYSQTWYRYFNSTVSCQKGPTRHAYAWQIGPFWQDTLELFCVEPVETLEMYGVFSVAFLETEIRVHR